MSTKIPGTRTMASILTEAVRADIISGVLPPHSKLKLRELSGRYDCGIIPLREALSRLAQSGFVEAEDQRGFRVTGVSEAELIDITQVRQKIEADALRAAIEHGDLEWETQVHAALHRLSRIEPTLAEDASRMNPDWEIAHTTFHTALLAACPSRWLLHFASTLREQTARYRHLSLRARDSLQRPVGKEHHAIASAALARDTERACGLLAEHFAATTRMVLEPVVSTTARRRARRSAAA